MSEIKKSRTGFLTPNQEKGADKVIKLKGIAEMFDGPAIKMTDNQGLERLKVKMSDEVVSGVYEFVDELFRGFGIEP